MNLGTGDKKKVYALCGLGAFALYMVWSNLLSGPSVPSNDRAERRTAAPAPLPGQNTPTPPTVKRTAITSSNRGRSDEWHPVLRKKGREQAPDPDAVDPTLRLNLLAKLQQIEPAGGTRNLFQISATPPPTDPKPSGKEPTVKVTAFQFVGPKQPPPPGPPPPPPPPPPIPYKFYGFSTVRLNGKKTAYFLDSTNEIVLAKEGDTLQRRYRVVRIGPSSVLMEDTESKRQQALPLAEESQS